MRQFSKASVVFGLALVLLVGVQEDAEAQRRGGRSRSGSYQRTNARGQAKSGTWSTKRQTERGQNYRNTNRQTDVNTERGTWKRERNNRVERTGENTYDRSWDQTTTSPNGRERTWKGEGSGTVERTDNGHTRTYEGTVTTPRGQEHNVDKVTTRTKTDTGWEKSTTKTVTDSQGNVIGSGERNSVGTKGEGVTTDGTWTNERNGNTTTYNGSSQKTDEGWERNREYSNSNGTRNRQVRWQYVDGQWVRTGTGSDGGSSVVTEELED